MMLLNVTPDPMNELESRFWQFCPAVLSWASDEEGNRKVQIGSHEQTDADGKYEGPLNSSQKARGKSDMMTPSTQARSLRKAGGKSMVLSCPA
jgi:hypothetical protein